jgi:hypothetical protein
MQVVVVGWPLILWRKSRRPLFCFVVSRPTSALTNALEQTFHTFACNAFGHDPKFVRSASSKPEPERQRQRREQLKVETIDYYCSNRTRKTVGGTTMCVS